MCIRDSLYVKTPLRSLRVEEAGPVYCQDRKRSEVSEVLGDTEHPCAKSAAQGTYWLTQVLKWKLTIQRHA